MSTQTNRRHHRAGRPCTDALDEVYMTEHNGTWFLVARTGGRTRMVSLDSSETDDQPTEPIAVIEMTRSGTAARHTRVTVPEEAAVDPQPSARPDQRGSLTALIVIVAVIAGGILALWLNSGDDEPAAPSLCSMLGSGWTVEEIAQSDEWRTWREDQSQFQRELVVTREANADCPNLVGL